MKCLKLKDRRLVSNYENGSSPPLCFYSLAKKCLITGSILKIGSGAAKNSELCALPRRMERNGRGLAVSLILLYSFNDSSENIGNDKVSLK